MQLILRKLPLLLPSRLEPQCRANRQDASHQAGESDMCEQQLREILSFEAGAIASEWSM
jgi:hypothetical protein